MEREEVFEKVVEICKDVFNNDELMLTETSSMAEVEEWDSLTHIVIMSDLEEEFNISFTLDEITNIKNLEELVNALMKHLEQ